MSEKNILDFWPLTSPPRPNQVKALEWLEKQTANHLILEAPVGSGKSAIGLTYSLFLGERTNKGDSYILTPQRILQEQYETSFRDISKVDLSSFYGKSNYWCSSKNVNCEIGSLFKTKCKDCPHTLAKKQAILAGNTVLNYKLALLLFGYGSSFQPRKLLVMDECHTLESHLVDFDALSITEGKCKRYDINFQGQNSLKKAHQWLIQEYSPHIASAAQKLEQQCEYIIDSDPKRLTTQDVKKLKELDELLSHVDEVLVMANRPYDYIDENFVLVFSPISFQFKRLYGAYSFNRILKPASEKKLFMSSTILDRKGFCSDLQIPVEDSAFLSLDSDFPVENRPIYYTPAMKMNKSWNEPQNKSQREHLLSGLIKILNLHKEDTGLIHTGNFEISKWLVSNLQGNIPHKIFHHNPDRDEDRNTVINNFVEEVEPCVLISPSSTEGLDLKEDLGRFAIFVKIPFGNLGDQWIKKRMDLSTEWYQRKALIDIIQGGGRVVRSKDDWGIVYILDESWTFLYKQTFSKIPRWWKQSYQTI